MNLSLKQKALVQTVGIFASIIGGSILMTYLLKQIPTEAIPYIGGVFLFGCFFYLIYSISVSRLQYEESVKNLKDTFKD